MSQGPSNPYLRTKIMTASPEELRMMLYDGAIKFCRQGQMAAEEEDHEQVFNNLMRAQKIVLELSTSLNHEMAPELCSRLSALYTYIYRRLVDSSTNKDPKALAEAIKLLEYERETWQMLMDRLAEEGGPAARDGSGGVTGAQQTAMSSLSISG